MATTPANALERRCPKRGPCLYLCEFLRRTEVRNGEKDPFVALIRAIRRFFPGAGQYIVVGTGSHSKKLAKAGDAVTLRVVPGVSLKKARGVRVG